jgi:hypothetical protein
MRYLKGILEEVVSVVADVLVDLEDLKYAEYWTPEEVRTLAQEIAHRPTPVGV